ncbi:MAG: NAPDH-dependent diflavin reductase [Geoglossum simile]|nr:MAG: NAPDH-dependent diflavin reductase [Geoglossum simile]
MASWHRSRTALVLYGSETGNARDAAEELGRIAERLHFLTRVAEMDSTNPGDLATYSIALFVVSTTGQGDLPANTRTFWKLLLRKRLPPNYLQLVRFTTFGLGDSSYPKFNWAARKLHKRLLQLGANEIYPRGEADEQHPDGIDGSFLPWSIDLRRLLLETYPLPDHISPISEDTLLEPKWLLAFTEPQEECSNSIENATTSRERTNAFTHIPTIGESRETLAKLPPNDLLPIGNSATARLVQNMRVTPPTHWQDVRHLVLTVRSPVQYLPGDVLTIFPKNFPEEVDQFLTLMNWTSIADTPIQFNPSNISVDGQAYPPPPVLHLLSYPKLTLRSLLTHYLDITSIPRRSFFPLIAHFTNNTMHKERLLEFANPKYIDEFYDYTTRPRRSILEVLQEFSSVRIPWQWVAIVVPTLRGRQFSIASGGALKSPPTRDEAMSGCRVELLVAIVKYRTVIKKIRQGVCTRYIASLPVGTDLAVVVQKGGLNMANSDLSKPAVMIGPGTGVAPMRALIWERLAARDEMQTRFRAALDYPGVVGGEKGSTLPSTMRQNVLFFGCRNHDADYFFQGEWEELKQKGHLDVFTAFSRDQKQKIYVQDLVREQSSIIYHLLYKLPGIIYICGSSGQMPRAVRETLVEVFQEEGAMSRETAEAHLIKMEKEGRYKQETW